MRMILTSRTGPAVANTPVNAPIPLRRLTAGQSGQIAHITGRAEHVHRLREFGLHDGTEIEMFRPGNPCIFRLAGNKVCFRADDLLDVLVFPAGLRC